jgi:hypothetical protein
MLEFRKFDSDDNFSTMGDHLDVTLNCLLYNIECK